MKLYHGTTKESAVSILENGFILTAIESTRQAPRVYDGACFYGFDNFDDAENFAIDQCYDSKAVLSFEVDDEDVIADVEYDASAYIVTGKAKNIQIVWSQD